MDLKEYQKLWHSGIAGDISVEEAASKVGVDANAMNTYKHMVDHHYVESMEKIYINFQNAYKGDFETLIWEYYEAHPPVSWDLNAITKDFSEYLETRDDISQPLVELAEYEWGDFFVYQAKDFDKKPGFQLNPARSIHVFDYDIPKWVVEVEDIESVATIQKKEFEEVETYLVITRNPDTHFPVFTKSNLLMMHFIEALSDKTFTNLDQVKSALYEIYESQGVERSLIDQQVELMFLQNIIISL